MEKVQEPAEEKKKEGQDPLYDELRFPRRGLPIDATFPMLSQEDHSQVNLIWYTPTFQTGKKLNLW